ncbi:MAG: hypothetical protein KA752_02350 [Giesbergeria sp.]|nr:hypothetical protein [Giesbergeria sp.]
MQIESGLLDTFDGQTEHFCPDRHEILVQNLCILLLKQELLAHAASALEAFFTKMPEPVTEAVSAWRPAV